MGRGRDAEAVEIVHKVAAYNGRTSSLTIEMLLTAENGADGDSYTKAAGAGIDTSAKGAILRKLRKFDSQHVKSLFATRKLAYSTTLLTIIWGMFVDPDTVHLAHSLSF